MFNDEHKNRFLRSVTESEAVYNYYKRLFMLSESYEILFNKDLSEFNDEEMERFYSEKSRMRRSGNVTLQSSIRKYLEYSNNNGFDVVCNMQRIFCDTAGNVQKMRDRMAFNPKHMNSYMDAVFGDVDNRTAGIRLRCLLWLAFFGMDYSDAISVENSDIDLSHKTITKNGHSYYMCDESITAFYLAMSLTEFVVINPLIPEKCTTNERHKCDLVLRGTKKPSSENKPDGGVRDIKQEVNRKISKAKAAGLVSSRITYDTAKLSGLFYSMYVRELSGIQPSFKIVAISDLEKKESFRNKTQLQKDKKIGEVIHNYELDYELWKKRMNCIVRTHTCESIT